MRQPDETQAIRSLVDWTARQIHDPVWRLRYLQSLAPAPLRVSKWQSRKAIGLFAVLALVLVVAPSSLRKLGAANTVQFAPPAVPVVPAFQRVAVADNTKPVQEPIPSVSAEVWLVEKSSGFETYSNGLRIENQYAISHRARAYVAFPRDNLDGAGGEKRNEPVGIVYHTTESLQAPFESSQNNLLKQVGESLIEYVRRRRCYNFLIDRFGRVFRIVQESDAADHAGHSIWADDRYFYVNLNESFIGVSFEAQTGVGQSGMAAGNAQVRAAAMLTEMLRSRYKIPGENCVTHAQVSVNPSNMQIGYHVDWASNFPFERLGLPDNYTTPSPAISLFGFAFDESFEQRAGVRLAAGALSASRVVAERAEASHLSVAAYRKSLYKRYLRVMASRPR